MAEATEQSTALSSLLGQFDIQYPNAPNPSPALLAFVRGLGLNLAQSEDSKRQAQGRINASATDSLSDLERTAARSKENATADLIRRGVLRSGEANTRYARQAEDVADKRGDIERGRTEAIAGVENAYESAKGQYRTQALERVLGHETEVDRQAGVSKAQEDAMKRQEEASNRAYEQQKQAQESYISQMEALYKKYGG